MSLASAAPGGEGPDTALAQFILALRSRGFIDKVLLNAFERTPRAPFMAPSFAPMLYEPVALPLPCGQEAPDALQIARVLRAFELEGGHDVLEIGTGSGFLTGLMARVAKRVVTVERYASLHRAAAAVLPKVGVRNVILHHGDGLDGLDEAIFFDRIVLSGLIERPPPALTAHLKGEGILFYPGENAGRVTLMRWTKAAGVEPVLPPLPLHAVPLRRGIPEIL